VGQGYKRLSF